MGEAASLTSSKDFPYRIHCRWSGDSGVVYVCAREEDHDSGDLRWRRSIQGKVLRRWLAMVSYVIVFRSGPRSFWKARGAAGVRGAHRADLPGERPAESFTLVTRVVGTGPDSARVPTTPPERVARNPQTLLRVRVLHRAFGQRTVLDRSRRNCFNQLKRLRSETKPAPVRGLRNLAAGARLLLKGLADGAIADPTIAPSASPLSGARCSGCEIPNPTHSGRLVSLRSHLSWLSSSGAIDSRGCRSFLRQRCSTRTRSSV